MLHEPEILNGWKKENFGIQRKSQTKAKTMPGLFPSRGALLNKNLNRFGENSDDSPSVGVERISFIAQSRERLIASEPQIKCVPSFSTKFLKKLPRMHVRASTLCMPHPQELSNTIDEAPPTELSEIDIKTEIDSICKPHETRPRKLSPFTAKIK
ncbi:unnamed protein product [Blepharisma stoltei]|uniref:Uncharacterized protein n=1 Tax=Blepharisma stoltei TaxID=1481888 RepID=A0AAU9IUV7_9CILI|nr:unnamed protein product [Blepharisma stoltei]